MPTRGLTQWQVAKETTWGTPVAGAAKLMGMQDGAYIQSANRSEIYPDIRASLAPGHLDGLEQKAGKGEYDALVTFEDVCYFFDNAFGEATPSGTGPYTRAYAAPIATVPTPRVLTFIHGSSQSGAGIYKLEGGLVNSMNVKGQTGKPTMISGDLIGQTVTTGALAGLSNREVEVVMGQPWLIYMDAVGGTIGSTQLATTAVNFELAVNLNRTLLWSMDALEPDSYEHHEWSGSLKLGLRFNTTSKTEVDAIVAQTAVYHKQIRLKQVSSTKEFQIDFAGTLKEPPKTFEDEDRVLTANIELHGRYNAALGNWLKAQVINSVAALA